MKDETVWLSQNKQLNYKTIRKHINNALKEELDTSTVAKFEIIQKEGQRDIIRNIKYYNLDMIISVGYRVKNQNGVIFRKQTNKDLKEDFFKIY